MTLDRDASLLKRVDDLIQPCRRDRIGRRGPTDFSESQCMLQGVSIRVLPQIREQFCRQTTAKVKPKRMVEGLSQLVRYRDDTGRRVDDLISVFLGNARNFGCVGELIA